MPGFVNGFHHLCHLARLGDRNVMPVKSYRMWAVSHARGARCMTILCCGPGHTSWVLSVDFHPTGNSFATGSSDSKVKLWDFHARSCVQTLSDHSDQASSSPNLRSLLAIDKQPPLTCNASDRMSEWVALSGFSKHRINIVSAASNHQSY